MKRSIRKDINIFGREVHCEYGNEGMYSFAINYTNQSYNDNNNQICIQFLNFYIYASWGEYNKGERVKYGFDIVSVYASIYYGLCDQFEEGKDNKILRLWYSKILDIFIGKEYRVRANQKYLGHHELIMDHGDKYNVKIESDDLYSIRPRIFFARKLWTSWEMTPDRGIPHSGKGENSWDCGDDATFSMSTGDCKSTEDAILKLKESCERDRKKYGMATKIEMEPLPKKSMYDGAKIAI